MIKQITIRNLTEMQHFGLIVIYIKISLIAQELMSVIYL